MASRNVTVNVIGDSRSLERTFDRSARASKTFGREVTGNLGKVDKGIGRLQSITAGGFIGGAAFLAVGAGLRSVLNAAADAQQVLGQTKVALEATGKSWADYGNQIESAVAKQSKLGFDDEALLQTFSLFVRQTNDVGKALEENNLAMDVARARFIDLEQAAAIVNKAALGMAGSLRRLGIDTKGATTGTELLTLLTEKYGGSAQRAAGDATTAFDRMQVSIDNLKEAIGGNLLPTVSGLADTLSDTVDLLGQLGRVKVPPIHIPLIFDTGGSTLGRLAHKAVFTLPEFVNLTKNVVGNLIDDFKGQSDAATPEAARGVGLAMSDFIDNVLIKASTLVKPSVSFGDLFQNVLSGSKTVDASGLTGAIDKALGLAKTQIGQAIQSQKKGLAAEDKTAAAQRIQDQFTALIASLQLGVDRASLTKSLDDDLGSLKALKAGLERQVKAGVDVTAAQSQLVTVVQAIRDKQREVAQAQQFRALGLSATGDEIIPGSKNLAARINQTLRNVDLGKVDISSKLISRLRAARRLINTEGGKLTEDTRRVIDGFIKAATGQDNQRAKGPLTKTSALNVSRILDGLGLSRDDEKELRARLSSFNSAGLALGGKTASTGRFATGQPVVVESHTTVTLDGDVVGRAITRSQQKAARRNPPQRRGPNAR